ncbi:MAG: hypothetical protein QM651_01125 [Rhodoblastus sp.]
MTEQPISSKIFLSRADILALGITGSNVTWLRREKRGLMPRRIRIAGTRVCWDSAEILKWIEDCRAQRVHHHYADY